ncbi:unnamed protein product [Arctogadus glacialis]
MSRSTMVPPCDCCPLGGRWAAERGGLEDIGAALELVNALKDRSSVILDSVSSPSFLILLFPYYAYSSAGAPRLMGRMLDECWQRVHGRLTPERL